MKLAGVPFENSKTCKGVAFVSDEMNVDMSVIEISGRYPESGWALNGEVSEIVYVQRGKGRLYLEGGETEIEQEAVVAVPAGRKFFWDGDMTLIMACNPPFNSGQYSMIEEKSEQENYNAK